MKIAISGASGFIGRHLAGYLTERGHDVTALVRNASKSGIYWDPEAHYVDTSALNGIEAVIHLAGESVAERWTNDKKTRIYNSRVGATRLLAEAISGLQKKPAAFICASAIGYYGERGSEVLTEDSEPGSTFLARVCVEWEAAAAQASFAGIRSASLRFGIVLSTTGGAFPKMLAPFEMGAGGRLASGKQYMSWIMLRDALRSIEFILSQTQLSGPVNIVAPQPVTNSTFTELLGATVRKPTVLPIPATMAYMAYGQEMTDEVLLASDRVVPERLSAAGFQFEFPQMQTALDKLLQNRI